MHCSCSPLPFIFMASTPNILPGLCGDGFHKNSVSEFSGLSPIGSCHRDQVLICCCYVELGMEFFVQRKQTHYDSLPYPSSFASVSNLSLANRAAGLTPFFLWGSCEGLSQPRAPCKALAISSSHFCSYFVPVMVSSLSCEYCFRKQTTLPQSVLYNFSRHMEPSLRKKKKTNKNTTLLSLRLV